MSAPTTQPLQCDLRGSSAAVQLRLRGDLDRSGAEALSAAIEAALARTPTRITIDLRGLSTLDSAGVTALLEARARVRAAGCRLLLLPGRPSVQRVFALSGTQAAFRFAAPPPRHDVVVRDWLRRLS